MAQMIAKKAFVYAGRRLSAGDEFQTHGSTDSRLFVAIGHAEMAPPKVEKKAVVSEPQEKPTRHRFYNRRDLMAE